MKQQIQKEQLNLKEKGQEIQCQIHKEHIIQLNINQNKKLGERLLCGECQSLGQSVLLLKQAEQVLYQLYIEEQQAINKEKEEFNHQINLIQSLLNETQKQFSNIINALNQEILANQRKFNQFIEQNQVTQLSQLTERIAFSQNIDALTLQETAEYLSHQSLVNGKFVLTNKIKISDEIKKFYKQSNDNLLTQLNLLKNSLQDQINQGLQEKKKIINILKEEIQQQQEKLDYDSFKYNDPIQLKGHNNIISSVAMSNNEQLIASGDYEGQIILWELHSRQIKQKYNCEKDIQDLIFSFDDILLAAAQYDSSCDILIFNLSTITESSPYMRLQGHSHTVSRIVFTSNSQFLISGSYDFTLRIWKLDQQKEVCNKNLSNSVYGVNISPNQKYISACCYNGYAYLFDSSDIQNTKELIKWQANVGPAYGTTFTPDSKMVLISGYQDIKLWDIDQLLSNEQAKTTPLKVYKTEKDSYFWSMSIRMNTLISNDEQIRIWNIESGKLIQTLDVPGGYQYPNDSNFSVSKDMKYIITGGQNEFLQIYELKTKLQEQI